MNGTPEQIAQVEFGMTIIMSLVLLVFVFIALYFAYEIPSKYSRKYKNNVLASTQILEKATKRTLNFLIVCYAFLLPLILCLIYVTKSFIILHPCLVLMLASIIVIKGTKEGHLEDLQKEYEKLHPDSKEIDFES
jgi:predicted histidine transporter YuiF (NhaC family)